MAMQRRAGGRYGVGRIIRHLGRNHPAIPRKHANEIALLVSQRTWVNATLGGAIGIVITNYVRHELTDYERLLRVPGMTRDEARRIVADDVKDVLTSWAIGPAQTPEWRPLALTPGG